MGISLPSTGTISYSPPSGTISNPAGSISNEGLPPPSLLLSFADDKSLDPRITFTRASSGTYWDASGVLQTATTNTPRFTHNPSTLESLGLLIEEQRTNLLTYSEEFDNAAWAKTASGTGVAAAVTANQAISPDGTMNADLVTLNRGAGNTLSDQSAINSSTTFVTSGAQYNAGLFVKAASGADVGKEIGLRHAGGGAYFIVTLTDSWQRVDNTETAPSSYSTALEINNRGAVTADNIVSFHAWGAQLEAGSFPTSYIKTVASTATRAADNASMTGSNFSSWYNQSEGCFVVSGVGALVSGGAPVIAEASDGSTNNLLEMYRDSTENGGFYVGSGGPQVANILVSGGFPDNVSGKIAASYQDGYFSQASNGVLGTPVSSGLLPIGIDRLLIGSSITGDAPNQWNGTIASIAYYPTRLSNSYLQYLSA